jgi:L-malate glycosyltransferase
MSSAALTVVLVSTQRRWHGGEEQARLLAAGLRKRDHRCVVLARRGGAFAERMASEGFEVISFFGSGRGPAALWTIRHALRHLDPDVLHYNDSHAMMGAGMAATGLHIPARIAARRVDFTLRSPRTYRWFCDRVICVSRAVAKVCLESGLPEDMLRVVHDGVDPARARSGDRQRGRQSLELADGRTLLLCVATLTDHKGHRFLLEAMPEIIRQVPDVVLALAGDGELREPLERQSDQLGIRPHVRFLGFRQDVYDLIQAADMFVLPSHKEGLCSTLIDAMLAQRTIVTTTAGGIPELVGGTITPKGTVPFSSDENWDSPLLPETDSDSVAWTVPPRDPPALARAILRALASPSECASMQWQALRRAELLFTADSMVDATLAVYEELIG